MCSGTLHPSCIRLLKLGAGERDLPPESSSSRQGLSNIPPGLLPPPAMHAGVSSLKCPLPALGRSLSLFLAPCPCLCQSSSLPQFTFSISLGFCLTSFFHHFFGLSLLGVGYPCASPKSFPCRCPSLHLFLPVCVPTIAQWQPTESTRASERRKGLIEGHRACRKTQAPG